MSGAVSGRERELAAVDAFLDSSSQSLSVLSLTGPAGIGKTTIWRQAIREAELRNYCVLSARPTEAERRISFAALADLLRPIEAGAFDALVPVQRHAVEVALMRQQPEANIFQHGAIPAGVLSILQRLASTGPLIVAVDDAQWLDQETAESLSFVLRRLERFPVGVVVSVRLEDVRPATFECAIPSGERQEIAVGPLSVAALHAVLKQQLGQVLPRPILVRIANSCGGNPFYALEIARELERVGVPRLGEPLPVPAQLQMLVHARTKRLPRATQEALLVAACQSQPTTLTVDAESLGPAEDSGIARIEAEGRVRFTHPLLATALQASFSSGRRRLVHQWLAEREADLEERARHSALAATGPDESVAASLDAAAAHASARGATSAAIELSHRALQLTPEGHNDARDRRLLTFTAHTVFGGADVSSARQALEQRLSQAEEGELRAELRLWLAIVARNEGRPQAGYRELLVALDETENPKLAARIHFQAMWMAEWDQARGLHHCDAMLELLDESVDAGLFSSGLLMRAYFRLLDGQGADDGSVRRGKAIESANRSWDQRSAVPAKSPVPIIWPLLNDQFTLAVDMHLKHLEWARDVGDLALEMSMAFYLCYLELWRGEVTDAENWARHFERLVEQCDLTFSWGDNMLPTLQGLLDAYAGRVESATMCAQAALDIAGRAGKAAEVPAREILGFVALSVGDLAGVVEQLAAADEVLQELSQREPAQTRFHPDLIEALIGLGDLSRAQEALARFEERGRILPRPWILATGARCRALLLAANGDLVSAITAANEALRFHEDLEMPFERARTLLVCGQLLRRRKERRQARIALEEARSIFELMRAPLWTARADDELQRIHVRRAPTDLSPTEERVARLAAAGLTNRQIANRAFLSQKTVEGNLARVYSKLGIKSRAELGRTFAGSEDPPSLSGDAR